MQTVEQLRDALDTATEEVVKLQAENHALKQRLHREWNGKSHPFRCPVCKRFVSLTAAELDMNGQILYVSATCKAHGDVTPTGGWGYEDLMAALPRVR